MGAESRVLYEVALCAGLRANELRELTVAHLDAKQSGIRLDAAWTKNRKPGFQPLPDDLARRLAEAREGRAPHEPLAPVQTAVIGIVPIEFSVFVPYASEPIRVSVEPPAAA